MIALFVPVGMTIKSVEPIVDVVQGWCAPQACQQRPICQMFRTSVGFCAEIAFDVGTVASKGGRQRQMEGQGENAITWLALGLDLCTTLQDKLQGDAVAGVALHLDLYKVWNNFDLRGAMSIKGLRAGFPAGIALSIDKSTGIVLMLAARRHINARAWVGVISGLRIFCLQNSCCRWASFGRAFDGNEGDRIG